MLIKNPFWCSTQTPFSFPSTVDFVHLKTACSFLVVLPLGWARGLRHTPSLVHLGGEMYPDRPKKCSQPASTTYLDDSHGAIIQRVGKTLLWTLNNWTTPMWPWISMYSKKIMSWGKIFSFFFIKADHNLTLLSSQTPCSRLPYFWLILFMLKTLNIIQFFHCLTMIHIILTSRDIIILVISAGAVIR